MVHGRVYYQMYYQVYFKVYFQVHYRVYDRVRGQVHGWAVDQVFNMVAWNIPHILDNREGRHDAG
jgi:hypothetical protein